MLSRDLSEKMAEFLQNEMWNPHLVFRVERTTLILETSGPVSKKLVRENESLWLSLYMNDPSQGWNPMQWACWQCHSVSLRHEVQSLESTIEHFGLANVLSRCSLQSMCDFVHLQKSVDPNLKSSTTYRHGIANRSKALKHLQHSCAWASLNAEELLNSMILKNQCPPEPKQQILYTDNLTFKLANSCYSQSSDVEVVLSNTTPILVASSPHCLIHVLVPLCYFWS